MNDLTLSSSHFLSNVSSNELRQAGPAPVVSGPEVIQAGSGVPFFAGKLVLLSINDVQGTQLPLLLRQRKTAISRGTRLLLEEPSRYLSTNTGPPARF